MVDKDVAEEAGGLKQLTPTSTCVLIEGVLAQTPPGTKQKVGSGCCRCCYSAAAIPLPLLLACCSAAAPAAGAGCAKSLATMCLPAKRLHVHNVQPCTEGREWWMSCFRGLEVLL